MKMLSRMTLGTVLVLLCGLCTAEPAAEPDAREMRVDITPQPLRLALTQFAQQTGVQLLFSEDEVPLEINAPRVVGSYTVQKALQELLAQTTLRFQFINSRTIAIRTGAATTSSNGVSPAPQTVRLAQEGRIRQTVESADSTAADEKSVSSGIPEILVKGSRSLNIDVRRTEDSIQPYVVFTASEIERSQTSNLDEFLKTRLPMNTTSELSSQNGNGSSGNRSRINLRGLGTNQTLILVDGRRLPSASSINTYGEVEQPDINGIPLAAIERIEVLPSTASGIYGGGATGGAINIILKRDYKGLELQATYGSPFDTSAATRRFDLSTGFSLEQGVTHVMIAASHTDASDLLVGDRDFARRSRELQYANNPNAFFTAGSPPLGFTPNISSLEGDLTLDDGTPLGSRFTYVPLGYEGRDIDGGSALVANAGRYNLDPADDLNGSRQSLLSSPRVQSFSMNVRRSFGERFDAFLDGSLLENRANFRYAGVPNAVSSLPAGAPDNPFQQAISVRFPVPGLNFCGHSDSETSRFGTGLIMRLPRDWIAEADYSWSRARVSRRAMYAVIDAAGNEALRSGVATDGRAVLNVVSDTNAYPLDFSDYLLPSSSDASGPFDTVFKDAALRIAGPVYRLPAGALTLAGHIARRIEDIEAGFSQGVFFATREPFYTYFPARRQEANSYYLETRVPVFSAINSVPGVKEMELQVSARRDAYKTRSVYAYAGISGLPTPQVPDTSFEYFTNEVHSTDYTLGMRVVPLPGLALRASFGTGFVPPSLGQIASSEFLIDYGFPIYIDPRRGGADGPGIGAEGNFIEVSGGNPDLKPELSKSWSFGAILTPPALPGLRLSVDYTRIRKTDEIYYAYADFILQREALYPGRVERLPLTGEDEALGYTGGVVTKIDSTVVNLSSSGLEAYDFQLDYSLETRRAGSLHFYVLATLQSTLWRQYLPELPRVESVGHPGEPLRWRGNGGVTWERGDWMLGWNMQYFHSYFAYYPGSSEQTIEDTVLNQGSARIPSQIYHDLIATYEPQASDARWLAGTKISFGIQNLFDKSPPILAAVDPSLGFSSYSTYGDPRLRRYSVSVSKHF